MYKRNHSDRTALYQIRLCVFPHLAHPELLLWDYQIPWEVKQIQPKESNYYKL